MPDVIDSVLYIRSALANRVVVKAVETGAVDNVDNHFFSIADG